MFGCSDRSIRNVWIMHLCKHSCGISRCTFGENRTTSRCTCAGKTRPSFKFVKDLIKSPSFIHQYSLVLEAELAGTRAQSCDRYGSGILGKYLGVVCHCFPPPLDVPTFAAKCLYVRNDARDPSSERWNYVGEKHGR